MSREQTSHWRVRVGIDQRSVGSGCFLGLFQDLHIWISGSRQLDSNPWPSRENTSMSSSTLYTSLHSNWNLFELTLYKGMWDMECLLNGKSHKDLTSQKQLFCLFCTFLSCTFPYFWRKGVIFDRAKLLIGHQMTNSYLMRNVSIWWSFLLNFEDYI